MDYARLASLVGMYVAGVLSTSEFDELYCLLLSSPAAREHFDRLVVLHRAQNPEVLIPTATEFLEQYVPFAAVLSQISPVPAQSRFAKWFACVKHFGVAWKLTSTVATVAVCIVFGLAMIYRSIKPLQPFAMPSEMSTGTVARLVRAANVQWLGITNEVFVGDSFSARELKLSSGVMELEFKRGARVVVEGPARFQLVSDNEAFLHMGKLTAKVPDEAHGFKVTAPMLSVVDLGTEFGVRANGSKPAEMHVFTGLVEMQTPSSSVKRMTQGEAVRVEKRSVRKLRADRNAFVFEDELENLETSEKRERFAQWRSAARALSSDPAAVVHYTFEDQEETAVQVNNSALNATRGTVGALSGTWSSGRWPEKHGVTFASKADRIRFNVPNTLTSLTYMVWLRVDKLTSISNALAVTESGKLGEVHWQIYRDGRVALSAHSAATGANIDETWDRGISPVLFAGDRLGKWAHLTSVYDSSERLIKHYLNGEFISATPIKRPLRLKLDSLEIGNWGMRMDANRPDGSKRPDYLNRHWSGCIDEFALLGRAMDASEIREYYRRGRVAVGTSVAQLPR
jgi:hypothetical protein